MPIIGVTTKGLSFPEIGRIRKGMKGEKGNPIDLDYFRVEFSEGEEETENKFMAIYGSEPKEINIFLPFNEIESMFDGWLEAYVASRMLARSDGEWVHYRCDSQTGEAIVLNGIDVKTGEREKHPEDDIAGQDYQGKPVKYSPIGRLKVIVPELERAAYLMVTTGSWNDIRNISQQLAGLKELNNGVIKGVPLNLRRRDKEVMVPLKDKKQRMTKSLLSIEADPNWVAARIHEDKVQSFPTHIASTMLEPGADYPEPEMEILPPGDITPTTQVSIPPEAETPTEAVIEAPGGKSARSPHDPETLKKNIESTILKYDALLEQDGAKYQVDMEHDGPIVASVVDVYVGGLQKNSLSRYAIFTFLLGEGKGSTKTWTAQELGTIKNIWLKIGSYGEALGSVEEEE
ncbi:MAG TPA: hypothetical protein VMW39_06845, partial [bacterium]|nr:hypothetical protein [bacterium]